MAQVLTASPMQTTNAAGTFGVKSDGFIQGVAMDDPANRFNLAQGHLAATDKLPMWGGVAIAERIPGVQSGPYGSIVQRAQGMTDMEGFSVFNQAHNGLTTPNSPVPMYLANMSVSFYRFGSNMRIPVKASAAVIALGAAGASVRTPLAWDFLNQEVTTVAAAGYQGADVETTALTYDSENNVVTATAADHGLTVGQFVTITGAAPTSYNGTVQVRTVPSADSFTYTPFSAPLATPATAQGTVGKVAAADITLPVRLTRIQEGNSKVVTFDTATGYLSWNDHGSCALLLI